MENFDSSFDSQQRVTLPGGSQVQITQGMPPTQANVVVTSADAEGAFGPLTESVIRHLGAPMFPPTPVNLQNTGFVGIQQHERLLTFILTFWPDERPTAELLQENLTAYLAAMPNESGRGDPDAPEIKSSAALESPEGKGGSPYRTIWLPLMGTGAGGLSYEESLDITARAVIAAGDHGPEYLYLLDLPPEADPKRVEALTEQALALFERPVSDLTRILSDLPAEEDQLGREAIADSIAQNVAAIWEAQRAASRPYIIHLSGRWGSGKSSILNFLRQKLPAKDWVVVDYNAWRHQDEDPVWWSLLNGLTRGARVNWAWNAYFALDDWLWRFVAGWGNLLYGGLVVLGILVFSSAYLAEDEVEPNAAPPVTITTQTQTQQPAEVLQDGATRTETRTETTEVTEGSKPLKTAQDRLTEIGGLATGLFGLLGFFGQFWRRRSRTAEALTELSIDPTEPLRIRYAKIVKRRLGRMAGRSVAVLIDDVDRCDAGFVVKLLQSVQNVYADVPVLYVVAGDRDWIKSAYSQTYSKFEGEMATPGKELGDLFVEKIFQLSVNVPDLGAEEAGEFLARQMPTEQPAPPREADAEGIVAHIEEQVQTLVANPAALESYVRAQADPFAARAASQAAFRAFSAAEAQPNALHRLLDYGDLLDPNPRAIKRLVNLYAYRYGYAYLMRIWGIEDALARWCILETQFPTAVRALLRDPALLRAVNRDVELPEETAPDFPDRAKIEQILSGVTEPDIATLRRFG